MKVFKPFKFPEALQAFGIPLFFVNVNLDAESDFSPPDCPSLSINNNQTSTWTYKLLLENNFPRALNTESLPKLADDDDIRTLTVRQSNSECVAIIGSPIKHPYAFMIGKMEKLINGYFVDGKWKIGQGVCVFQQIFVLPFWFLRCFHQHDKRLFKQMGQNKVFLSFCSYKQESEWIRNSKIHSFYF